MTEIKQVMDSKLYSDIVSPYLSPNGLVDVWSSREHGEWKRLKISQVPIWVKVHDNIDVFYSVQQYKIHPKRFDDLRQEPAFAPLYFDFDGNPDGNLTSDEIIESARKDTVALCSMFVNILDLEPNIMRIWFSGSKGFHVTIDGRIFGITPNNKLHLLYKNIAYYYSQLLKLKTIDLRVYSYRRQWRIPGSRRTKKAMINGEQAEQYKTELTFSELSLLTVDEIKFKSSVIQEPLYDELEYRDISPINNAVEWIESFIEQFRIEERLFASRAKRKIVIPADSTDKEPSCIKAVRNYVFAENKRNQALIVLTTFLKDSNVSMEQASADLSLWTEGIPWGKEKTKERLVNCKAVVRKIYENDETDGDIYRFTCQYVRALAGRNSSGDETVIPCHFEQCKFVQDITDQNQEQTIQGTLIDVQKAEYFMKRLKCIGNIVGFGDRAYSIPLRVKLSCCYIESDPNTQNSDMCPFCSMLRYADNKVEGSLINEPYIRTIAIDVIRRGLDFTNVTNSQKMGLIRGIAGIPKNCQAWNFDEEAKGTLRELLLRSTVTSDNYVAWSEIKKQDIDKQIAFVVHNEDEEFFTDVNLDVELTGIPVNSPKDQSIYFAITKIKKGHSELDKFQMTPGLYEQLKAHQAVENQSVWDKLKEREEYMSQNVTHIRGRFFLHLAVDLVYHCPPFIKIHEMDNQERGMMQLLVVGDPAQGKSTVPRFLRHHYQLGGFIEGSSSARTGLLYAIDTIGKNRILKWGAIPQEDMRLIIIDEFQQVPSEDVEQMTGPRTNGIIDVRKVVSGKTLARARMIFMANPRNSSGRIDVFGHGIFALTTIFPKQQDVRRLDTILLLRSSDIPIELVNKIDETPVENFTYSSSSCHNLLLWAWTRQPDKIVWSKKSLEALFSNSTEISQVFECDISIAQSQDMRYRLGRITQAVAALLFSTDSDGEKLYIKPEHVKVAAEFFYRTLTDIGSMYFDIYAMTWKSRNYLKDDEKEQLDNMFLSNAWFVDMAEFLLSVDNFAKKNLVECCDLEIDIFEEIWKYLITHTMVRLKDKYGYEKSPKFTGWLRASMDKFLHRSKINFK